MLLLAFAATFALGVFAGFALAIAIGRRVGNQRKAEMRRTMASIDAYYARYDTPKEP